MHAGALPTEDDPAKVCQADAVEFLRALPDDSVDLLFTSPPYELARTYGIGHKMVGGQKWVDWMVEVVRTAAPKVKGLIAINCEGQTRGYRYSCAPFLLIADLHRAGFNLRKPCVFQRQGIPGSGQTDWLRNDWEPVVCVTRKGQLPWSDNTACGHAPKSLPGGAMSYRGVDGKRRTEKLAELRDKGNGHSRKADGSRETWDYIPPELSNPGNVIDCGNAAHPGHDLAHENEAPFPMNLVEFFVKSFCPPGGLVCDPFAGSGTTGHAAVIHGRRFIGCDIRESQVALTARRLAEPLGVGGLFAPTAPVVIDLFTAAVDRPA